VYQLKLEGRGGGIPAWTVTVYVCGNGASFLSVFMYVVSLYKLARGGQTGQRSTCYKSNINFKSMFYVYKSFFHFIVQNRLFKVKFLICELQYLKAKIATFTNFLWMCSTQIFVPLNMQIYASPSHPLN
jgi:hypothetical protein